MTEESTTILSRTLQSLRGHTSGELQFDEHVRPVKVVIVPDGRMIGSVMVAMLESANTVLFMPHADDDSMQVQVTLERFEEEGEAGAFCDRWRIYHGEPEDVRWAIFNIDAVRFESSIIDGDALIQPNQLARSEATICRLVNTEHREQLQAMVKREVGLDLEGALLVGIDPYGLDVRGPFDVVRVPFVDELHDPSAAEGRVLTMLAG